MSRKDYIAFAEMIAEELKHNATTADERRMLRRIAGAMTHVFCRDNARFDTDRFLTACGFDTQTD